MMSRRLNIAVDIDDTLTLTFQHFQPYVAEYFGADVEELRAKNISYENLPDAWQARQLDFYKAYFDRVVPDTPFKSDAAWGIHVLRALGHRIIIITARTTAFYADPYATTVEELRRGGIEYDKLLCTFDKANACVEEKIDVLIDDLPRNCEAVAAVGVSVINMISPVNRDMQMPYPRVKNWAEAVDAVRQIADQL